jgi:hypothetical protein
MKNNLAPVPVFTNDPSKYMVHSSARIEVIGNWVSVHSARKSARGWDFMAFLGANETVSPMSSTAHLDTLLVASLFWTISPRGQDNTVVT